MRAMAMLMAVFSLLGAPQDQRTDPEVTWETAAILVLEESPETAARTLLDWAKTGETAPEAELLALL